MPTNILFKKPEHKQRFVAAMQAIGGKIYRGTYDPEYGAALYVLTADASTWQKARDYVSCHGIDFGALLEDLDWSGGHRALLQWAANLFNEQAAQCNPVELMRLDESNFHVALSALLIRRYGLQASDFTS